MIPRGHLIYGAILAVILWSLGMGFLPILLIISASLLIDIDHLINYIAVFKRFNIIEMLTYLGKNSNIKNSTIPLPVFIFHNFETLFILAALSLFFPFMAYILAGVLFHMILDWIALLNSFYPKIIKFSLVLVLIENKIRRRLSESTNKSINIIIKL